MKREIISFKIAQPKHRAHHVLFCEDTPFKPKRVDRKDGYRRKEKHPKRDSEI